MSQGLLGGHSTFRGLAETTRGTSAAQELSGVLLLFHLIQMGKTARDPFDLRESPRLFCALKQEYKLEQRSRIT